MIKEHQLSHSCDKMDLIRRYVPRVVFFIVLLFIPIGVLAQSGNNTHAVEQGETLYSIARQYNVSVGDLRNWNSLQTDALTPGQSLQVRSPDAPNAVLHAVKPGETLFSLSRDYNVTIAELQQWNSLQSNVLDVGFQLTIYPGSESVGSNATQTSPVNEPIRSTPGQASASTTTSPGATSDDSASQTRYHTVRSGETLSGIARQHGMTIEDLLGLNSLQSANVLRVGQVLTVRPVISTPVIEERESESTSQGRFVSYQMQGGESVQTLLDRYSMSIGEFRALNPEVNPSSPGSGRYVTLLLPPTRSFENPYRRQAAMQNLGRVPVFRYDASDMSEPTTNGELYNPSVLTAAHSNMTLGEIVYIENPSNGKGSYVKINDRFSGEGIKLSDKAFELLGYSTVDRATALIYLDEH